MGGASVTLTRRWWRVLAAVDTVIVTAFAVVAAVEPYHVLSGEGVELQNLQGLLPTMVVVALRAVVLAGERYLLPVAHGVALVAAARLASVAGFFYTGRWLFERTYGRWDDFFLGGILGYALVGVAALGLVAFVYGIVRLASPPPVAQSPGHGGSDQIPAATFTSPAPRRGPVRDSLIGLVGVFVGIAGLIMGVNSIVKISVAVVVAAAVTVLVAIVSRGRPN